MKSKSSTLEHLVMPCFLMHMLSSCYVWVLFPLDCCVAVALFHRDVLPRPGDGLGLCGAFECPAETPRAAHKVPKLVTGSHAFSASRAVFAGVWYALLPAPANPTPLMALTWRRSRKLSFPEVQRTVAVGRVTTVYACQARKFPGSPTPQLLRLYSLPRFKDPRLNGRRELLGCLPITFRPHRSSSL
jgi:hypothetical protein